MRGPISRPFARVSPCATRKKGIRWLMQQNELTDYRMLDNEPYEFLQGLCELQYMSAAREVQRAL